MNIMRKELFLLLLLTGLIFPGILMSQDIPERPVPPRLVNDLAKMLSLQEAGSLERKLVAFNDSTSTQIAIVTVSSLNGYDIIDFAQRLGEKWGIGQKQLNNGLLILIKQKTAESGGEITIVQGYGLEGAIPDLTCASIIDNEILPAFSKGNVYGGLDRATTILMALASGEFSADQYGRKAKKGSDNDAPVWVVILIIIIIFSIIGGRGKGSSKNFGSGNLPLWLLLSMMNSGGSHKGSWGGFSGGSGGGGFGGFGGGSFGGGGARGSW